MIEVIKPGLSTTLQDLGRPGWQAQGVSVGGAADPLALRIANTIVGNREDAVGLECALVGPVLRFHVPMWIALAGACAVGQPSLRRLYIAAGTDLSLVEITRGARLYLVLAGGVQSPLVLGSASTSASSGWPGLAGRALRAGDRLQTAAPRLSFPARQTYWSASFRFLPSPGTAKTLRVLSGPQWEWFSETVRRTFLGESYGVSGRSDRMGVRLQGSPLLLAEPRELISEGVAFGSVQVPPDGQLIVLSAERQTLGGYPKIANVITADRSIVAQLRPGDRVRFEMTSPQTAYELLGRQERALTTLRAGLAANDRDHDTH